MVNTDSYSVKTKAFDCMDHNKLWKILQEMRIQDHLGCILSPCLFNFYAEYIMRNSGLEEEQAGIKTAGRNINNLRYADDTTLTAESEEN